MRRHLTLSLGCLILSAPCLAQTWTQKQPTNKPSIRAWHRMAYDFLRQRIVMFGGNSGGFKNDTWEWDGNNWKQIQTKNSPAGRWVHGMVYDFIRRRIVIHGGGASGGNVNDTWEYDGKDWTKVVTKNAPSPRHTVMAYDFLRQRTVLFGGNGGGRQSDTWEYDGKDWTKMNPKTTPPARGYHLMVYDLSRGRVVMFGGLDASSGRLADTWEYDGKDWKQIKTKTTPPARYYHAMAYDRVRKVTVMFGGWNTSNMNDTWEYDGTDWTLVKTTASPTVRRGPAIAYDVARQQTVVFGGDPGRLNDTWVYVASKPLDGSPSTISIASGGTHAFTLDAGSANAGRLYWIFGSVTGTSPGVTLGSLAGSVTIPLQPDFYTDITIALANSPLLTKTRGALDNAGKGSAALNVPKGLPTSAVGVKFYHAYLVYDAKGNFYMASNPVEMTLVK